MKQQTKKIEIYNEKDLDILLTSVSENIEEEIDMDRFVIEMHVANGTTKITSIHKLDDNDWELYNPQVEEAKAPIIKNPPLTFWGVRYAT